MERNSAAVHSHTAARSSSSMFGGDHLKRSPSQLNLEECLEKIARDVASADIHGEFCADGFFGDVYSGDLSSFGFKNRMQDTMNGFSSSGGLTEPLLSPQNLTPKNSSFSATMDSQSSICVGTPTSAANPVSRDNQGSGSSGDQSDEASDDFEIEAGPCGDSTDPLDIKRIRRKISNRDSARRSRRRKQQHLQELEGQVDILRVENSTLYRQLTDASQQYRDADTNNRVLKSDVEALRAQVKLAESMVASSSLTSSFNQLLQDHVTTPQPLNPHTLGSVPHVSPTITIHGDDASYARMAAVSGQNSGMGLGNADGMTNNNMSAGIMSDIVSCGSELWY